MDNETTVPSVLMARDFELKPAKPAKPEASRIVLKIGIAVVVLLFLVLLYRR
jgi:hypothetical protein